MEVAVISDNTFQEDTLKKYIEYDGKYSLAGVYHSVDSLISDDENNNYSIFVIDYYNEKYSIKDIRKIGDKFPSAIIFILTNKIDKKYVVKLLTKLAIEKTVCYDLKNISNDADLTDMFDAMVREFADGIISLSSQHQESDTLLFQVSALILMLVAFWIFIKFFWLA